MTSYEAERPTPSGRGAIRVSDADRDEVLQVLSTAYAEGRITREEHDERTELATRAKTFDDFTPLTSDLIPAKYAEAPRPQPETRGAHPPIQRQPDVGGGRVLAIMGGSSRRGAWKVPAQLNVTSIMGGVTLDFREAIFTTDRVEITGYAVMGGIDIRVPEGVNVLDESHSFMGSSEIRGIAGHPDGPTLVLRSAHLMGGLEVKGPNTAWNRFTRSLQDPDR